MDELIDDPRAYLRERGLEHWSREEADRRALELVAEWVEVPGVTDPVNVITRACNLIADILYTDRFSIDVQGLNVGRLVKLYEQTGRPMTRQQLNGWINEVYRSLANHWRSPCNREELEGRLRNRGVLIRDIDITRLLVRRINAQHPDLPLILVVPNDHKTYKPLFVTRAGYEASQPDPAVIPFLRLLDG